MLSLKSHISQSAIIIFFIIEASTRDYKTIYARACSISILAIKTRVTAGLKQYRALLMERFQSYQPLSEIPFLLFQEPSSIVFHVLQEPVLRIARLHQFHTDIYKMRNDLPHKILILFLFL